MGDYELADAVWRLDRVMAIEIVGSRDTRVARAIYNLAATTKGSTYDDVFPYLEAARSMLDPASPEDALLTAQITRSLGHYYRYRDRPKSVTQFREAIPLFEHTVPPSSFDVAVTRVWLGWTLFNMGQHVEGRRELDLARQAFIRLGQAEHSLMATIESVDADVHALDGDWPAAEAGYRRAARLFERARREQSTRFAEYPLHGYNALALAQLKQEKFDEAWTSLQRYRSPSGVRLLGFADWRTRQPASFETVTKLRHEVVAKRSLRRLRQPWATLDEVDWDAVIDELEANAQLARLEASYPAPDVVGSVGLADVQAALPDDWAYVGWLDSRIGDALLSSTNRILDSRWMYIVRKSGPVQWIPLWEYTLAEDRNDVRRCAADHSSLLARASTWGLRVENDAELARLAKTLAAQEFNVAAKYLQGINGLVVEFFEEHTAWTPLECLIGADGAYLGDRFAISYVPSAAAFVTCERNGAKPAQTPKSILIIGDPVFSPDGVQARPQSLGDLDVTHLRAATNGIPEALDRLPRLPYAAVEIKEVKVVFPQCTVLAETRATELAIRGLFQEKAPTRYDVIHFTTHGLAETPLRQRCALALSRTDVDRTPNNDGLVDALEIQLGWTLDAGLVTLSGCQTASGSRWFRGEPTGLAGIMLGVGARSVLASMWQVDDLATTYLMGRFYENLSGTYTDVRDGHTRVAMSKAEALAEAKMWLREHADSDGRKPFAHPAYWAGFVLMGAPN